MKKTGLTPTNRFSDRVSNYIKYRPGYPSEIIAYLKSKKILDNNSVIADIGSGTGKLTEIFLKNKNIVYGVEPNEAMRKDGEKVLKRHKTFRSIKGTAENTTLPDKSIDLIIAGQAFHWFKLKETKREFGRILKNKGHVALIWNDRDAGNRGKESFLGEYEDILVKFGSDFKKVRQNNISKKTFNNFFKNKYRLKKFYNYQLFDYKGLKGRLLSSSYIPLKPGKKFDSMLDSLKALFDRYKKNGKVKFEYICEIYTGKI